MHGKSKTTIYEARFKFVNSNVSVVHRTTAVANGGAQKQKEGT